MIELKPEIENLFFCPECRFDAPTVNKVLILSVHTMVDCTCNRCGLEFYQTLPVGHNVEDQLSVSKTTPRVYQNTSTESWLFDSLDKAHKGLQTQDVKIEKLVFKTSEDVVILNTLDYLYGHVLLKLYNSLYHLDEQRHLGLILIIPKSFEWLIPAGCAEVWIVDLKLNALAYHHYSIQNFVSAQFNRFKTIYLSRAYSHPDFARIDISRLTKIKPFDLTTFTQRKPAITFILREDRWWFPTVVDYWFYRICRKLKILQWGSSILCLRQNRLVKDTIQKIRKKIPDVQIHLVGLGKAGSFKGYGEDTRTLKVDDSTEISWCKIYSDSHVVVGIHGSNMLLPTALAAGCVEILPPERYGNMVQDISVRYDDRKQLFFYRFADQYASPGSVAAKVLAILEHYDCYHKNMCQHLYKHNTIVLR